MPLQPADRRAQCRQSHERDGQAIRSRQDPGQGDRSRGNRHQEEEDGVAPGMRAAFEDRLQVNSKGLRGCMAVACVSYVQ